MTPTSASSKPDRPVRNPVWPEWTAVALSVLAVLFSGYALIDGQRQHRDERASELMAAIYDDWDEMSMVDQWEVLHLIEAPATYEQTRDRLREYTSSLPREEQLRIALLERAVAGRISAFFEHHLNQWRVAVEADDPERQAMLQVELDFWCHTFLRNPRMLWFLSDEGGMMDWFDPPNQVVYRQCVLNDPEHPLAERPDPVGILPDL